MTNLEANMLAVAGSMSNEQTDAEDLEIQTFL